MAKIRKLVLDVLKPHKPTILDLASALTEQNAGYNVNIKVVEIDDKTETLEITVRGNDINLETISEKIGQLGGSVHSIDEVEMSSES